MAVGIGLKTEMIAPFYEELDREIRKQIAPDDLERFIAYDGEAGIEELTPEFFACLDKLSPFGHSNQKPVFRFNDLKVVRCGASGGGVHTRGLLQGRGGQIDFIAFNRTADAFQGKILDVLATPQLNRYQQGEPPQLNIIDIREVY